MQSLNRQSGLSMPSVLIIALMVGFFAMSAIRLSPAYFEYLSVREIISNISHEPGAEKESVAHIRRKVADMFNTNQIYHLQPKEVEVYRKDGYTYIDANYEVRLPLIANIDATLKFDDLLYVVGGGNE